MLKKNLIITAIIFAIAILIVYMFTSCFFAENPPYPVITYAEFPFKLTYELNGEIMTFEDVYICEFKGFQFNEGIGEKCRIWEERFASGLERITLLEKDDVEIIYYQISKDGGMAGVFMGDPYYTTFPFGDIDVEDIEFTFGSFPNARVFSSETIGTLGQLISAEEMWELYKLKLLNLEIGGPIENSF